jgi:hypothetical protein
MYVDAKRMSPCARLNFHSYTRTSRQRAPKYILSWKHTSLLLQDEVSNTKRKLFLLCHITELDSFWFRGIYIAALCLGYPVKYVQSSCSLLVTKSVFPSALYHYRNLVKLR